MLATGALHTSRSAFVLAGTSEIIGVTRPPGGPEVNGLFTVPSPVLPLENIEIEYGPVSGGGSTLAWLSRLTGQATPEVLALIADRAHQLSPILFRPYLDGERAPYWDHTLAAGFEGIRSHHTLADLVHAVLQGVALQERLVLERSEQGDPAATVVLAGGAARDSSWNQIRANILQRRVLVLADPEASLRGAALLAWSGAGAMPVSAPPPEWFEADEILPDPKLSFETSLLTNRFLLVK
ncbi:MAG: FGGY-family carbohydrate kinase, partial [Acidobacteria bacterium]|nr:FGGY-family carbohydrate kinase [Acidobacteriota bacterium]